jgi:hypothetical protein
MAGSGMQPFEECVTRMHADATLAELTSKVGQAIGQTGWIESSQARIQQFADAPPQ